MALIFVTYNKDDLGINLTYLYRKHLSCNAENSNDWLLLLKKFVCEVAWFSFKSSAIRSKNSDINVDIAKWYLIFYAQTDLSDYSRYLLLFAINQSVIFIPAWLYKMWTKILCISLLISLNIHAQEYTCEVIKIKRSWTWAKRPYLLPFYFSNHLKDR